MGALNEHVRHGALTASPVGAELSGTGYVILEKMRWRTPPVIVERLAEELRIPHFDLDAAAEDAWALAPRWYTSEEDCLDQEWGFGSGYRFTMAPDQAFVQFGPVQHVWFNPPWGAAGIRKAAQEAYPDEDLKPFPGTERFVEKAWRESRSGMSVYCLMPQALNTVWQRRWIRRADEVRVGPRVRFRDPHGVLGPQPPGGHLLLIFRPHVPVHGWSGGPRVVWEWDPFPPGYDAAEPWEVPSWSC